MIPLFIALLIIALLALGAVDWLLNRRDAVLRLAFVLLVGSAIGMLVREIVRASK